MNTSPDSKQLFSKDYLVLFCGLSCFFVSGYIHDKFKKPITSLSKQQTALNVNKNLLQFISAGNKRLITDLLWVQTLIESDIEHYKQKDLNNWLFLRFDTIAQLDPKFYENYLYGGQFLAIIKDDLEGASLIYDKGLTQYPEDYRLNYNAGFLNYYEMENSDKGLKYLSAIEHHPKAPVFISSIVTKLKLDLGVDLKDIFKFVVHNYETTTDEALKLRLLRDIYSLKAEIDLTCLNQKLSSCDTRDAEGNPYVLSSDKKFHTQKDFLPYRINRRDEEGNPEVRKKVNTL